MNFRYTSLDHAAISALFGVFLLLSLGCSESQAEPSHSGSELKKVVLQLKWHHQFQFAGYYAAKSKGYFAEEGLDVEIREGGPEIAVIDRVVSGEADFGVSSSEVVLERMRGKPVVACAVIFQHSAYVLLTDKASGIRTPSDFDGKTLLASDAGGSAQFRAMMIHEGVSLDEVEFASGPWNLEALVSGQVDAVSGYRTTQAPLLDSQGFDTYIVDPMDYGIDFYGDTLFTTENLARNDRDLTEAMIRASLRGWEYAMENPGELVDLIEAMPEVRARGRGKELLLKEAQEMRSLIVPDVVSIGHMNPGRWENIAEIYSEVGIAPLPHDSYWLEQFVFKPKDNEKASLLYLGITAIVLSFAGFLIFVWSMVLRRQVEIRTVQVREQSRLNQLILDTAMDAVIGVDTGGLILQWNGQSEQIFGVTRNDAIGRSIEEFLPNLLTEHRLKDGGPFSSRFETDAWRTGGEIFPAELSLSKVTENSEVWLNIFVRDVTERRRLEDTLRQSQKMQSIGQLAGGVAHDFNNLLTVIQGNASLSLPETEGENRDRLEQIVLATERASGLTRQLLAFSRQQPMKFQRAQVNDSVRSVSKMLQRLIGEDIRLELNLCEELTTVKADPGMLEQALLNLAVNARDAMPQGGTITIETRVGAFEDDVASSMETNAKGEFVRIRVRDNGVGISNDELPRIFEPFYTTKDVGKGTGLGLATVFGIVQQHEGWMDVESFEGVGSVFSTWIPLAVELDLDSEKPEPVSLPERKTSSDGTETILLAEDENMVRMIARKLLTMHGYRVIEAESGRAALDIWDRHREDIDLLLTDVVMPEGVSGHDLAQSLQSKNPELKVLYTSGYSADIFRGDAVFPDDAVFIGKPYDVEELLGKVRDVLDGVALAG